MPRRVHIHGERGRWVAEVDGRWLAVLHNSWRAGPTGYFDPMDGASVGGARYAELVGALRDHDEAVIQRDKSRDDFSRAGYVGVFRFKDLAIGQDGSIRLTLVERTADPLNP